MPSRAAGCGLRRHSETPDPGVLSCLLGWPAGTGVLVPAGAESSSESQIVLVGEGAVPLKPQEMGRRAETGPVAGRGNGARGYLRWRIFARMRRFFRPTLRRPLLF